MKCNSVVTVTAAPLSVVRKHWVQGQQTEISHVPEERKKLCKPTQNVTFNIKHDTF